MRKKDFIDTLIEKTHAGSDGHRRRVNRGYVYFGMITLFGIIGLLITIPMMKDYPIDTAFELMVILGLAFSILAIFVGIMGAVSNWMWSDLLTREAKERNYHFD